MTINEIEPRWLRRTVLVFAASIFYCSVPIIIIPFSIWDLVFHGWDEVEQGFAELCSVWRDVQDIWTK